MKNIYFNRDLKQYIRHFLPEFILFLAAVILLCVMSIKKKTDAYDSPNTERVYGERRVFDYGEKLTAEEEQRLEEYIHKAEKKVCLDIVIVTLNESLKGYAPEYASRYSMVITPDRYVMVYADKFWEDNKFGYDQPQVLDGTPNTGDGVILVDNVHREEETGKIYTWMGTTGKAERKYSSYMIDAALDVFYERVDSNYYLACRDFVDRIVSDFGAGVTVVHPMPFLVSVLFVLIYAFINCRPKLAKKTVTAMTYIVPGTQEFTVKEDKYLRSNTTKTYSPQSSGSSSGGGGGHHSSGGGGSHGGGGHSR